MAEVTLGETRLKICSKCRQSKTIDDFNVDKSRQDGKYPYCKECHRSESKHYNAKQRESKKLLINNYKNKSCSDCKQWFPLECMDLDHVRGKKFITLARAAYLTPLATIKEELEKCDVVCSNCHRIRTMNRRQLENVS
jgi:hypothetical protein